MARAETLGKRAAKSDGTSTSLRDYTSLLGVIAAGVLGMSLLCVASAIALANPYQATPIVLEPASIIDLAVSNLNTVSALTVQAAQQVDTTPIFFFSTGTASPSPSSTSTSIPPSPKPVITRTQPERPGPTSTPKPPNTPKPPPPTKTIKPPKPTATSIPPTIPPTVAPTNIIPPTPIILPTTYP